jgi:hypothetical protein
VAAPKGDFKMLATHTTSVDPVKAKAARRYELVRHYAREARQKRKHGVLALPRDHRRFSELEKTYGWRYGTTLPDDDAGREDFEIAAHHLWSRRWDRERHIHIWAAKWCPWLSRDDVEAAIDTVAANPRKFSAATLGKLLRLTDAERTALGITTIRAFDVSWAEMVARRRERDRQYRANRRLAERASRPAPLSQTKPWEAEGISRATWYRRQKAADETNPVGSKLSESIAADGICLKASEATEEGHPVRHSIAIIAARDPLRFSKRGRESWMGAGDMATDVGMPLETVPTNRE